MLWEPCRYLVLLQKQTNKKSKRVYENPYLFNLSNIILDIIDGFSCRWSPIISNFLVSSPKQANSSGSKTSLASSTSIANGFVFLIDSNRPMHPTIVPPITAFFSYTSDFALTLALWYYSRAISISTLRLSCNFVRSNLYFCS